MQLFQFFFYCRLSRFLGRPRFLFPTGVHLSAGFDILSSFFLKTWPIHLHLLVASMLFIAFCPVVLNSCLFEIFRGQNNLIMFQRHLVWKVDRCLRTCSVIRQHSESYIKEKRGHSYDITSVWFFWNILLISKQVSV